MPAIGAGSARFGEPVKLAVADDMAAILGGLRSAGHEGGPPTGRTTQVRTILEPRGGKRSGARAGIAAALLVGVVGVALGVAMTQRSAEPTSAPPAPAITAAGLRRTGRATVRRNYFRTPAGRGGSAAGLAWVRSGRSSRGRSAVQAQPDRAGEGHSDFQGQSRRAAAAVSPGQGCSRRAPPADHAG
jgi:hypothetical protein